MRCRLGRSVGGMDDVVVARVAEDAVLPARDLEGECGLWTAWVAGCWGAI